MKQSQIIEETIRSLGPNELILAGKLYREALSGVVSEAAYYKTLERMCKAGTLAKVAKGTYHLVKKSPFGPVPLSEKEIVTAFTKDETGTVIGYSLYNSLGLTTQISKTTEVLSSGLEEQTKTIRNVHISHLPLHFSKSVERVIHALEVLQNVSEIQDVNYSALLAYCKEIAEQYDPSVLQEVLSRRRYPKSTLAFLREVLDYYGKPHNLNQYLSSLSVYKYPKMEALYEAARVPQ